MDGPWTASRPPPAHAPAHTFSPAAHLGTEKGLCQAEKKAACGVLNNNKIISSSFFLGILLGNHPLTRPGGNPDASLSAFCRGGGADARRASDAPAGLLIAISCSEELKRSLRIISAIRPLKRSTMPLVCGCLGGIRRCSMCASWHTCWHLRHVGHPVPPRGYWGLPAFASLSLGGREAKKDKIDIVAPSMARA